MKVKNIFLVLLLVIILAPFLISCDITYSLGISSFKEFRKDILRTNSKIEKIKAEYDAPGLYIIYTLKNNVTASETNDILAKTEQLINNEEFQKEFFKVYFSKFKSSDYGLNGDKPIIIDGKPVKAIYYPDITVYIDWDNKRKTVEYITESVQYGTWEYKYKGKVDYYEKTEEVTDKPQ